MPGLKEYEKIIKPMMSEKRFRHSQNVAKEAVRLAKKYGADPQKAETAGILHDIMKDVPPEEQLKKLKNFGIMLNETEMLNRKLWHSVCGAVYIEYVLGIDDYDIINAVRYHTSGRENMSPLEKCIFVADFTSKDRDYDGVDVMRKLADKSLELAMVEGIRFTVTELLENENYIDPSMIFAYNDALKLISETSTVK